MARRMVVLAVAAASTLFASAAAWALTAEVANPWDGAGGSYYITAHPHCHGLGWTIPGWTGDGMTCGPNASAPHPSQYQMSDMGNGGAPYGGPGHSVYFHGSTSAWNSIVRGYVFSIGHPTGCSGQDVIHVRVDIVNYFNGVVTTVGAATYGHLYGAATEVSVGQYISVGTKLGVEDYAPLECAGAEHIHMQLVGTSGETWHGDQYWTAGNVYN